MTARFYFANLCADVSRFLKARAERNETRAQDALSRAYRTLSFLRNAGRPEAYEEGLLLLRGAVLAAEERLEETRAALDALARQYHTVSE